MGAGRQSQLLNLLRDFCAILPLIPLRENALPCLGRNLCALPNSALCRTNHTHSVNHEAQIASLFRTPINPCTISGIAYFRRDRAQKYEIWSKQKLQLRIFPRRFYSSRGRARHLIDCDFNLVLQSASPLESSRSVKSHLSYRMDWRYIISAQND